MPQIHTYTAPVAGLDTSGLASAARSIGVMGREGADAIRSGLNQLGTGVEQLGAHIQEGEDQQENQKHFDAISDYAVKKEQEWDQVKSPNVDVADWLSKYRDGLDALGDDVSNGNTRAKFNEMRNSALVTMTHRIVADRSALAGMAAHESAANNVQKLANLTSQDPANVERYAAQSEAGIDAVGSQLGDEDRVSLKDSARSVIYGSAATAWVQQLENNPDPSPTQADAVKKMLSSPQFVQNVSPNEYSGLIARVDKTRAMGVAASQRIAEQDYPDLITSIAQGGSQDQRDKAQSMVDAHAGTNAADTAVQRAAMQRSLNQAIAYGDQTGKVRDASEPDALAAYSRITEQLKTAQPEEIASLQIGQRAIAETIKARDKAFTHDPAGYVLDSNKSVAASYAKFQNSPTPQAFAEYAGKSMAEQHRLYPDRAPALLTYDLAGSISASLSGIPNNPDGAAQAGAVLSQWAQQSGKYWPQLSQELMGAKVLNSSQYVAASLYAKPAARSIAEDVLRASVMGQDALAKQAGISAAKAQAAAQQALAPLANTLGDAANGHELMDAYETALTNVLLYRGSANPDKDAPALAAKMILGEYQFRGTLRIPNAPTINADDVAAGADAIRRDDLGKMNLVIPRSYSGLGPDAQRAAYTANVANSGHWVTNEDGSGAVLFDEQNHPVFQQVKGAPRAVTIRWHDLASRGATERGMAGSLYKFVTGEPQ